MFITQRTSRSLARVARTRRARTAARYVLVVLLIFGMLCAPDGRSATAQAALPAPAASYRLDAAIDLDRSSLAVSQTVQVRNVDGLPLTTLVFRVVPNALGTFDLTTLAVDGQPAERRLDGSVLEVALPSPLMPGASTVVDLRYTLGVPREPGRMTATARSMALGYWFPILAVHRGDWDRRQFVDVGDAFFSEVADYDLTVTTTTPAQVVATGQRVERDGLRTRFQATGVREVALAVSPDFVMRRVTVAGTQVEVAAASEERAAYYAARASEFLRWCNERLGPYPYPTFTVVDTDLPATFGGLEYPSIIFLSRTYPSSVPP